VQRRTKHESNPRSKSRKPGAKPRVSTILLRIHASPTHPTLSRVTISCRSPELQQFGNVFADTVVCPRNTWFTSTGLIIQHAMQHYRTRRIEFQSTDAASTPVREEPMNKPTTRGKCFPMNAPKAVWHSLYKRRKHNWHLTNQIFELGVEGEKRKVK
jgi:hypothetical protein